MATVFRVARYGTDTYGPAPQGQALPPPTHVEDRREQPLRLQQDDATPLVTLPREQLVNPHREGRT